MDILELTSDRRQEVLEKLGYFLKGDQQAIKLCIELLFIGHLWDDLIDKDKPRTDQEINQAFTWALGEIPINPYFPGVYHLIRNAINQWQSANELASGNEDEKLMSFLIRNALMEVVHYMMFLVGGPQWIQDNGADFWRYFSQGMAGQYQGFLKEAENA